MLSSLLVKRVEMSSGYSDYQFHTSLPFSGFLVALHLFRIYSIYVSFTLALAMDANKTAVLELRRNLALVISRSI